MHAEKLKFKVVKEKKSSSKLYTNKNESQLGAKFYKYDTILQLNLSIRTNYEDNTTERENNPSESNIIQSDSKNIQSHQSPLT